MLPEKMRGQADELRRLLRDRGWEVVGVKRPFDDEWWAAEIWHVESVWRPQGARAYLTFLVDPLGGPEDVWAVHATQERPRDRPSGGGGTARLGHGWKEELRELLLILDGLRR